MKRFAKKSLSILLAFVLASTMFVCAFAADETPDAIIMFNMDIDYKTNEVSTIYFAVDGYSVLNEDAFACSIFDSEDNEVFDQTMCNVSAVTPVLLDAVKSAELSKAIARDAGEEPFEFMLVYLTLTEEFIVNPDETYTIEIYAHAFSTAEGALSEEMVYEFLPADYIYIPTIWDKILWFLHSNRFFEFIFARVIMIIEFFYYGPYIPWIPIPIFG